MNIPSLGAIPSPLDYRDIGLGQITEPKDYPSKFMNNLSSLPVWHQHKIGACVGHACAKYKQVLDKEDTGEVLDLSPRFLYALAKCRDGYTDEGTYPRLVAQILKDVGCATEKTCPNNTFLEHEEYVFNRNEFNITDEMMKDAELAKIKGYAFVDITNDGLKQAICDFKGCSLLVSVGSEWWTDVMGNVTWNINAVLPVRPPKKIVSGHQIYIYGYEDIEGDTRFYFRNSWGSTWGDKGDGYFLWNQYKNFIIEGMTFTDIPDHILQEVKGLPLTFVHKFNTSMQYNDYNEEVKWLQRALKVAGYFKGSITGGYYDVTKKAVFEFQKKYCKLSWWEYYIMRGSKVGEKTLLELNKQFNGKN
jgi:hypothetical protein